MSGKHDKAGADEQAANLLLTGPIVIRGLGRGVKDALRPGRPSRHRAFLSEGGDGVVTPVDDVQPTPLQAMLASGPTVAETGPSSELAEAPERSLDEGSFPPGDPVAQTGVDDGPGEDRVDEAASADAERSQGGDQHDRTAAAEDEAVQVVDEQSGPGDERMDPEVPADDADRPQADEPAIDFGPPVDGAEQESGVDAPAAGGGGRPTSDVVDDFAIDGDDDADRTEPPATMEEATADADLPRDAGSDGGDAAGDDEAQVQADVDAAGIDADAQPASEVEPAVAEHVDDLAEPQIDFGEQGADAVDVAKEPSAEPSAVAEGIADDTQDPMVEAGDALTSHRDESPAEVVSVRTAEDLEDVTPEDRVPVGTAAEGAGMEDTGVAADESTADAGTADESTPEDGTADAGTADESTADETTPDESTVEDGTADVGTPDESTADESAPDSAVEDAGAEDSAADESAVEDTAADESAPDDVLLEDAPAGEMSVDDASVDEVSAEDASADDTGAHDVPIGEVSTEDVEDSTVPAEDEPSGVIDDAAETDDVDYEPTVEDIAVAESRIELAAEAESDDEGFAEPAVEGGIDEHRIDDLEQDTPVADEESSAAVDAGDESGVDDVPDGPVQSADESAEEQVEIVGVDYFEATIGAVPDEGDAPGAPVDAESPLDETGDPESAAADEAAADDPLADGERAAGTPDDRAAVDQGGLDEERDGLPQQPQAVAASVAAPTAVAAARLPRPAAPNPDRPRRPPRRPQPLRERFGREAIGIAVLVVLALICAGLITAVIVKTQRDAAIASQEAANYTPPPLATPEPTATGPVVAVIGDGTTSAAASGVTTAQRWSGLLGSALSGTVSTDASSGMGYVAKGGSGQTFVQAAAKVPSNAAVVVIFGGAADTNVAPLSLAKAATDAYAAAKHQAPGAKLVVVGPVISQGLSAVDLTSIRNTLRSAAGIAKATWVDPIGSNWLPMAAQAASSPNALTAADEKTIAAKMEAEVKKATP